MNIDTKVNMNCFIVIIINDYLVLHSDIISSIINTIKPPHNTNVISATSINALPVELYFLIMIVIINVNMNINGDIKPAPRCGLTLVITFSYRL